MPDPIDLLQEKFKRTHPLHEGGGGGTYSDMNERITRLEGSHDGLKHSQSMLFAAIAVISAVLIGGMAIVVAFQIFQSQQTAELNRKVDDLPEKIRAEIRDLTQTISGSITAAKPVSAQPPTVIVIPTPAPATGSTAE